MAEGNILYNTLTRNKSVLSKLFTLFFQFVFTFIFMFGMYMIYALLDGDFGIDGLFGLVFIQPVLGIIFSLLTISVCFFIGFPIRMNKKCNHWWRTHFYVSIIGIIFGIFLSCLAVLPFSRQTVIAELDGEEHLKTIPHIGIAAFGWILTAFSMFHIYFPPALVNGFYNITTRLIR